MVKLGDNCIVFNNSRNKFVNNTGQLLKMMINTNKYTLENIEGAMKDKDNPEKLAHRVYKTKKNKTKIQRNMCCTPLYVNKHK